MRILVVDDEPLILDTITPFLERCGHDVVARTSVEAATTIIDTSDGAIDLVISDVCLPGRDGTQLLHQVREQYPDIDIVLMTAYSQIIDVRQAIEEGAAGFMRKPIKLSELRTLVEQVAANRLDRTKIRRLAV